MKSIWNKEYFKKNTQLFKERFPGLFQMLEGVICQCEKAFAGENPFSFWSTDFAKNGSPCAEENGLKLCSYYNPEREASGQISDFVKELENPSSNGKHLSLVFEGLGLGYAVVQAAEKIGEREEIFAPSQKKAAFGKKVSVAEEQASSEKKVSVAEEHPASEGQLPSEKQSPSLLIFESEPLHLFASFACLDWEKVFRVKKLVIALTPNPEEAVKLMNQFVYGDFLDANPPSINIVTFPSWQAHDKAFFATFDELVKRNKRKDEINRATTKKFGARWNKNCIMNARAAVFADDVGIYEGNAEMLGREGASLGAGVSEEALFPVKEEPSKTALPFLILAAGPSLKEILPHIKNLSERAVVVAVDTALRACLSVGYQPDFVILTDPQYYAARHLSGLSAKNSVLVTSQDVYPSVFRFDCRKIVCSHSQMPLGQFFESICGKKADLGSGGSVASCAWNFAKLCGAKKIYLAGLDLSFPKKETHARGSTFEQKFHASSLKIKSSETKIMPSYFSGNQSFGTDFFGNPVITDSRMKMFAWWFESRFAECPEIENITLNPYGLKIPGVKVGTIDSFMREKIIVSAKREFFALSEGTILKKVNETSQSYLKSSPPSQKPLSAPEEKFLPPQKKEILFQKAETLLSEKLSPSTDGSSFIQIEDFYAVARVLRSD